MGIRKEAYEKQSKQLETNLKCKKISDARRFINRHLNYLENKAINDIKISLFADFNDRKWEE